MIQKYPFLKYNGNSKYICMAAVILGLLSFSHANPRIDLVEEQIRSTEEVIQEITNITERAAFEKKLELLKKEKSILERRLVLQEQEKELAGELSQNAKFRLTDVLSSIDGDLGELEEQLVKISKTIKKEKATRAEYESKLETMRGAGTSSLNEIAEQELRLDNLEEILRAGALKRSNIEFSIRLVQEADRIDHKIKNLPINPKPSTKSVLEKKKYLSEEVKQKEDTKLLLTILKEQKSEIQASMELSQAQLVSLDEEISVLGSKLSGINKFLQRDSMLARAKSQKRLIAKKIEAEFSQRDSVDESIQVVEANKNLYDKEIAFLTEDYDHHVVQYIRRILIPILSIIGIFCLYILLSRLVFPFIFEKDELFNARRLGGYIVSLASLLVICFYFLDDLQAIATVFGIAGAALVIALQDLLSAIAGWFVIVTSRKIKVGDRIEVDGRRGDIIDIQLLRTTLVELNEWLSIDQPTGRVVVIPNSFIFKQNLVNYSHMHKYLWGNIDILITFESSVENARNILMQVLEEECAADFDNAKEAAEEMEKKYGVADSNYQPKLYMTIEDSGVLFKMLYISHYKLFSSTRSRISNRIVAEFDADKSVEFAYPTQRLIPTAEAGGLEVKVK